MAKTLTLIGEGRPWEAWRQDLNHRVEVWLPFGIGWVYGGNHSLTAGIVACEGVVTTDEVYDLSELFDHVRCDGEWFLRTHDGSRIERVRDARIAALFQLGARFARGGHSHGDLDPDLTLTDGP